MDSQTLAKRVNELIQSPEFLKLQSLRAESNLFEIVAASHTEMWHSAFVKWILDPNSSLGLGTFPLKRFLYMVVTEGVRANARTSSLDLNIAMIENDDFLKLHQMEFYTEYSISNPKGRIDIIGINEEVRITIENKIKTKENEDQTERYYQYLSASSENVSYDIMIFLSPDESSVPKCDQFIQINYQMLCDYVLKPCLTHPSLSRDNQFLIGQYISNLRKPLRGGKIMAQPNKEICQSIYNTYKDVLDEIYLAVKEEVPASPTRKKADKITTYSTTLTQLVDKGIISINEVLVGNFKEKSYEAVLIRDARDADKIKINFNNKIYNSPSLAASAITEYNVNGWAFWRTKSNNETLSAVRDKIEAE